MSYVKSEWLTANDYIYFIPYAPVSQTQVVVHLGKTYFKPQGHNDLMAARSNINVQ